MSDNGNRSLVMILLICTILYYRFIRFTINMKGEYNNRKCNPLNMFIGGIVGTSQNDVFEQCASNVTNSIVDDEFKMYEQNRTREMNANYNNLNSKSSKTAEEINESAKQYIKTQDAQNDLAEEQLAVKEATETAIRNSSGILSNTFVSLQNIMKNFSDAAKSFVNSNAVKKL